MPVEELTTVSVKNHSKRPHLDWIDGDSFILPTRLLDNPLLVDQIDSNGTLTVTDEIPEISPEVATTLRLHASFNDRKPASSRFPLSYQIVPPSVRMILASAIGRWKRHQQERWAAFPRWPIDLSADFLDDLLSPYPSPFALGPTPVILSHDLDSPEGLENVIKLFLPIEESVGACSTNFIVPCSWSINHDLLNELKDRGHTLGIHGYDHSNTTAFSNSEDRKKRLYAAQTLIDGYAIKGYRSPSLIRTRELIKDLASIYSYDSSIPTSGGLFPVPNNGCASARPFNIEGIIEIPLSMPRDGSLRFLGYSPNDIFETWKSCADIISRSGGIIFLLTHCEYRFSGNPSMLEAYQNFLHYINESDAFTWSTPADILEKFCG